MTNIKEKITSKNTKTILFASLIAAMILPFSGMNYAVAEDQRENNIGEILAKADPFTSVNKDQIVIVDYESASEVLTEKELNFIKTITDEQNNYVNALRDDSTVEINMLSAESQELLDYFTTLKDTIGTDEVNAQFFCSWWAQGAPSTSTHNTYTTTLVGAQALLVSLGYHQTPAYATYGWPNPSYPVTHQYNDFISVHGCWDGVFRSEGVIDLDFSKYYKSTPEPNPEIFGYLWPQPYWPVYVAAWHNQY